MQRINLYRYEEEDSSITVTPIQRNENDIVHRYRIVADEGMILEKDETLTYVVDVKEEEINIWNEIEDIYSEEVGEENE